MSNLKKRIASMNKSANDNQTVVNKLQEVATLLDEISGTPNSIYTFGDNNERQGSELSLEALELIEQIIPLIDTTK